MKKILDFRQVVNIVLFVMIVGSLVFLFSFGACMYMARKAVSSIADDRISGEIEYVQNYIDTHLERVEDIAYNFMNANFGTISRLPDGSYTDSGLAKLPSEAELYAHLSTLLRTNPLICGAAIGFDPSLYGKSRGRYGFAPYVTKLNVEKELDSKNLGDDRDYVTYPWYAETVRQDKGYWAPPFQESITNHLIISYNLPIHDASGKVIGAFAVDIDTDDFSGVCARVAPYPNSEVCILDQEYRFLAHPDSQMLLQKVYEIDRYSNFEADDSMVIKIRNGEKGNYNVVRGDGARTLFYFAPIRRTGWLISIECPETEVYSGMDTLRRNLRSLALISILFMVLCFMFLFRQFQKMNQNKANIEGELRIASAIQMGMIPKLYPAFPKRHDLDVYGFLKPAKTVGGDLFDYFIRNEKYFFCIGDVSGKGVPASLYMAVLRSLFRNVSLNTSDPSEIATALNRSLSEGNVYNMFSTMFIGVLDLATGHLDYCNAGHNAPLVGHGWDGGTGISYTRPQTNVAVGIISDYPYVKEEMQVNPGDTIFLYTDGVTEAEDVHKVLYGESALQKALENALDGSATCARDVVDAVYRSIQSHSAGAVQSDDITMLMIEYKGYGKA